MANPSFVVGEHVDILCSYKSNLLPSIFPDAPKTVVYSGKVLNRANYDDQESIRIFTGDKRMMVRVIPLKDVISVNGVPFTFTPRPRVQTTSTKVVDVVGSKGDVYKVTIYPSGKMTCTCSGFGFRQKCSHIEKIVSTARAS